MKEDKPLDLSSLVGQCIKLSNEFLNDYKLVIEFSEWIRIKKSHHRVKKS
jgi:hypothetical protein